MPMRWIRESSRVHSIFSTLAVRTRYLCVQTYNTQEILDGKEMISANENETLFLKSTITLLCLNPLCCNTRTDKTK